MVRGRGPTALPATPELLQEFMGEMLAALKKYDDSWPFREPVNASQVGGGRPPRQGQGSGGGTGVAWSTPLHPPAFHSHTCAVCYAVPVLLFDPMLPWSHCMCCMI